MQALAAWLASLTGNIAGEAVAPECVVEFEGGNEAGGPYVLLFALRITLAIACVVPFLLIYCCFKSKREHVGINIALSAAPSLVAKSRGSPDWPSDSNLAFLHLRHQHRA